jgi:hypothetical protein
VNVPALLTLAGFASLAVMVIVACFSRWKWHSPWVAACLAVFAAAVTAAGATEGQWLVVAAGVALAFAAGKLGVASARVRVTVHGGEGAAK